MQVLDFAFIGKRIREVRSNKHLTQEYLADATGVNVSHISNIELNKVKVSLSLLVQICNALDVSMDYLLENEYHKPTSALENELLITIRDLPKEKQETLLKIAKVL
ncbi:MAG: helix-turn-helix transcriptional regulator [Ruminococcaceae bacterium]|nr:helix-turn-helix transcriptional regulator [Oscillospiraceae bacterium]